MARKNFTIRKKKVYPSYRKLNTKLYRKTYYTTSKIILEGNYLTDAGFEPHQEITIKLEKGKIIIEKAS